MNYSHQEGFSKQGLLEAINVIDNYNVKYIIWNKEKNNNKYSRRSDTGNRELDYSFDDFTKLIETDFNLIKTFDDNWFIFKKN